MLALSRASSDSGNFGLRTTSATRSIICGPNSLEHVAADGGRVARRRSPSATRPSVRPPRKSAPRCGSWCPRAAGRRSGRRARPRRPFRTRCRCARSASRAPSASSPTGTSATWRPLSSVNRFGSGTLKSRGAPGFGGSRERRGRRAAGSGGASRGSARACRLPGGRRRVQRWPTAPVGCSVLQQRGAAERDTCSCAHVVAFRLRRDRQDRPVGRPQVLLRRLLDQLPASPCGTRPRAG